MADTQLADRLSSILERSPHVPHRKVILEASHGQVTLRGVVRTYYQKQMAQEVIRGLDGVEKIENQLVVDWGT